MPSRKTSILVVEDDIHIFRIVRRTLELEGYQVLYADCGEAALQVLEEENPDLIILDIMLPGMDGYTVCKRIREFSLLPIIMLTARGQDEEKIRGFEAGADDYVTKPFNITELLARVKAVLRRSQIAEGATTPATVSFGEVEINFAQRQVTVAGRPVSLTPTEFNLLQELVLNRGKVLTHTHLLQKVWGPEYRDEKEYLHVFVSRLRKKLHLESEEQKHILTIPGVGYQLAS